MRPARPTLTVDRARVTGAHRDTRAHLEAALARVSPAAIGIPDGALLVVRRLATRTRLGPGLRADAFAADMQEMLRTRLANARTAAAAGDDDDLLFHDEADLATAVIASWLTGDRPAARTWTRIVTGARTTPDWWRQTMLPDARRLPQVIAALARRGQAAAWLARLDDAEVRQATQALATAHGIALSASDPPAAAPAALRSPRAAPGPQREVQALFALVPEAAAPARQPAARILLALALTLDRRPSFATTPAFARALTTLAAGMPDTPTADDAPVDPIPDLGSPAIATARPTVPATAEARSPPIRPASPGAESQARPPTESAAAIETRFGGIFFILNALIALDLYGDFTRPRHATPGLSPFDLLALLGRRWFGARFRRDPIAPLLATLAGRPAEQHPARTFTPPRWDVPDAWLAPWPDADATGFPLEAPPSRWVASLADYLRARLTRALDTDPTTAVSLTCRQPATVRLSGDRVTATFALADHPIALRLAGLDRDPGWLPAARRDVAFVFA